MSKYEHATYREYYDDTYKSESTAKVLAAFEPSTEEDKGLQTVVLDKTILHPQGGGQPGDIGYIEAADGSAKFEVADYRVKDDAILHLGRYLSGSPF